MSQNVDIGTNLGPFRVVNRLGAGGAGTVFEAVNDETDQTVALKTLLSASTVNEEIHSRFVREIAIAQRLSHPNIVAYDDCGVHGDVLFYTMELVPWGPLNDVLTRKRVLPWRDAAECGIQICRGLAYLHHAGIVHRDLKPANIFLSDDGQLKLGDFGLARDLGSFRLTVDGKTVGTAKYLAPEQARAEDELDGRTDLYALGCILFEMTAGRPPFIDDDAFSQLSYFEMMKRHVEEAPPDLAQLAPACPAALVELIHALLAKQVDQRPETAFAVDEALEKILNAQIPVEDDEPIGEGTPTLTERLHEESSPDREVNWKVLIVIVVLIGALIALVLWDG